MLARSLKEATEASLKVFTEQAKAFGRDLSDLHQAFGKESQLYKTYKEAFAQTQDLAKARNSLIPNELRGLGKDHKLHELYGLLKGVNLNQEQAPILSKILKKTIPPTPGKFNNYVIVESVENSFTVKTTKLIRQRTSQDFFENLDLNPNSRLIVKGKLDKKLIEACSKKGVKLIRNYHSFLLDHQTPAEKLRLVFVASRDKNKLKALFNLSDQQAEEMLPIIHRIDGKNFTRIVDTKEALAQQLRKIRGSENLPTVIFNNNNDLLFGKNPASLRVNNYITCKSYGIDDLNNGHLTTDFIYFQDFILKPPIKTF